MVGFKTVRGQVVNLRVASSFISIDQAQINLREVEGKSFDAVKNACRDSWNAALGRIQVSDTNIDRIRTFYSCLYRSLLSLAICLRSMPMASASTTARTTAR